MSYGVSTFPPTACTVPFAVWSGAFMSTFEADGRFRPGARSVTLTTYNGDKVKATMPDGVTLPRTEHNYQRVDAAISEALTAHYAKNGSTYVRAESEADYVAACDAMHTANAPFRLEGEL